MHLPLAHVEGAFAPLELLPLLLAAGLYARRSLTLAEKGRPVPLWRQLCFAGGLLTIAVALVSPIAHIGEELVIAHMVEHLLLGDVATLLLVLGLTGPLLQPILAIPIFDRLRILAHPLVAFPLWAANFYFWHVPALYDAAYGGAFLHLVEHSSFIFFGCLMWMPIFGPLPKPGWFNAGWKVAYVIAVRFAGAILGNVLMWSGSVLYPKYAAGEAYWGISPLADQSTAGVVMMIEGTFLGLGLLAWVFFEVSREGIEKQRLLDLALERGVELDEARAQRAVAAGQAERLERQLVGTGGEGGDDG
ncbi:MAG TPA: cytochrome c oxidase assembly protein [Solirubrobacterales bacterium]|jgi:cytochrome c oxidase assembly factor CtaG|nr:cytochrome c oxidase assembly protein [Solirubrobacterales bacterium]